jgi:putative N-acetylmannosamine-6-phosphate epimerase
VLLLVITASKNALPSRLRVHFALSIVQSPAVMGPQVNQQELAPVQTACVVAGACALADAGVTNMPPIASTSIVTIIGIRRRDAIIMACMMIPFYRTLERICQ